MGNGGPDPEALRDETSEISSRGITGWSVREGRTGWVIMMVRMGIQGMGEFDREGIITVLVHEFANFESDEVNEG